MIRRRQCSSIAFGMALLLSGCPVACSAQQTSPGGAAVACRYDTAGVRLEGTLTERKEYGPPGYGETPSKDERTTILVLKLSSPISVQPAANAEATRPRLLTKLIIKLSPPRLSLPSFTSNDIPIETEPSQIFAQTSGIIRSSVPLLDLHLRAHCLRLSC